MIRTNCAFRCRVRLRLSTRVNSNADMTVHNDSNDTECPVHPINRIFRTAVPVRNDSIPDGIGAIRHKL
jgi:hypothetical protein